MEAINVLPGTETRTKLSKNTFTRVGWNFKEWNTKPDGTGTKYEDEAIINEVTEDMELFAMWEENIDIVLTITNNEIVKDSEISMRVDATTGVKKVELKNGVNILYTEDYNGNTTYTKENLTYEDSLNKVAFENLPFGELALEVKVTTQAGNTKIQSFPYTNYTIGNSIALEQFAQKVDEGNSFLGKTIYLLTSFTVSNHNPIGTWDGAGQSLDTSQSFSGTFEGNKNSIQIYSSKIENRRGIIWSDKRRYNKECHHNWKLFAGKDNTVELLELR